MIPRRISRERLGVLAREHLGSVQAAEMERRMQSQMESFQEKQSAQLAQVVALLNAAEKSRREWENRKEAEDMLEIVPTISGLHWRDIRGSVRNQARRPRENATEQAT